MRTLGIISLFVLLISGCGVDEYEFDVDMNVLTINNETYTGEKSLIDSSSFGDNVHLGLQFKICDVIVLHSTNVSRVMFTYYGTGTTIPAKVVVRIGKGLNACSCSGLYVYIGGLDELLFSETDYGNKKLSRMVVCKTEEVPFVAEPPTIPNKLEGVERVGQ